MNKYFNYPNKELWSRDSWTNTYSVISPLTKWISIKNHENFSFQLDPNVPKREGGVFSDKVYGYEYPEVTRYWADKGLVYHADSMTHGWVSMIPSSFFENTGSEPRVLLVLVSADLKSNDQWIINLLDRYESYNQAAADEGFMILYIASNGPDMVGQYVNIVQEFAAINHIKYKDLWLDVSTVYKLGLKLSDAPDFTMEDPDSLVKPFSKLEIPALNISNGLWANQNSLTVDLLTTVKGSNAAFDGQKVINSIAGEKLSTGIYVEYAFKDAHAPEFVEYIENMGLKYGIHSHKNEQWLSFVSKGALEEPENKLPVFVMLKEVNTIDPHQAITASGYCYDFIKLAAQGDFILVFFALESKEDNDMIHDILQELAEEYPADLNRVYIAGHSHNASFAMHYAIRNPGDIAAYATLGIAPGIALEQYSKGFFKFSDEDLDALASYDIPCINASGMFETSTMFPIYKDAYDLLPSTKPSGAHKAESRMTAWQRRLRAMNCPVKSLEEIAATEGSDDYVERVTGIPADKTECLYLDGFENYIADIKNKDGKYHLRIAALGGMPHLTTPTMVSLVWSFCRRFAKDPETGKTIELY